MKNVEQWEVLNKQINKYQERALRLHEQQTKLTRLQEDIVGDMLIEDGFLTEQPWMMHVNGMGNIYLNGGVDNDGDYRPKLFKLVDKTCWGDFSHNCEEHNFNIRASDGEVYMHFNDPTKTVETINMLGLEVDYTMLKKALEEAFGLAALHLAAMDSIEDAR